MFVFCLSFHTLGLLAYQSVFAMALRKERAHADWIALRSRVVRGLLLAAAAERQRDTSGRAAANIRGRPSGSRAFGRSGSSRLGLRSRSRGRRAAAS
jgi:hypothetical protein